MECTLDEEFSAVGGNHVTMGKPADGLPDMAIRRIDWRVEPITGLEMTKVLYQYGCSMTIFRKSRVALTNGIAADDVSEGHNPKPVVIFLTGGDLTNFNIEQPKYLKFLHEFMSRFDCTVFVPFPRTIEVKEVLKVMLHQDWHIAPPSP